MPYLAGVARNPQGVALGQVRATERMPYVRLVVTRVRAVIAKALLRFGVVECRRSRRRSSKTLHRLSLANLAHLACTSDQGP